MRNCLFAFLAAFALNANALLLTGTERVTASTFIFADLERHIGSAVDADGTVALTRYTADRIECALWTPLGGVRVISPPEAVRCHTRNIADGMVWGVIGYSSDVNENRYFYWTEETGIVLDDTPGPGVDLTCPKVDVPLPAGYRYVYGACPDGGGNAYGAAWHEFTGPLNHGVWWNGTDFEAFFPDSTYEREGMCRVADNRTICLVHVAFDNRYDCRTATFPNDFRLWIATWRHDHLPLEAQLEDAKDPLLELVSLGLLTQTQHDNALYYNLQPAIDRIASGKKGKAYYAAVGLRKMLEKLRRWLGEDADHPLATAIAYDLMDVVDELNRTWEFEPACNWSPL